MSVSGTGTGRRSVGFARSTRIGVIAVVMASLAMLTAGQSVLGAGPGIIYRPGHVVDLPDDSATGDGVSTGTNTCPVGHPHPTGGGVQITGVDPQLDLEVHATAPSGRKWRVQGNNNSGSDAGMSIFVICANGLDADFAYPHKTLHINSGHTNAAKVSCPIGMKVTGGGVAINGGNHSDEVTSSEPADGKDADHKINDAWFGSAGDGGPGPVTMTVTAACARHGSYVVKAGTAKSLPNNSAVTQTVMCPTGTIVVGGGTHIDGQSTDLELHDGFPADGPDADTTTDDGWQSTAYNDQSGHLHHMKTFAICEQ